MQTPTSTASKPSAAATLVARLATLGRTLATAESCTGGALAAALTDVPGASRVFPGGVVSYADETKAALLGIPECLIRQHGAVSAEVAAAMASGAAERCGADYGIATTGFAGPDGGTEADPVGTVYIGLHTSSELRAVCFRFEGDRDTVRRLAVEKALTLLLETTAGDGA